MKISKSVKSNFFLFLAAAIWGFAFVAQCVADDINIFLIIATRYLLGSVALLPIILLFENKNENREGNKPKFSVTLKYGALCGTVLFIASALQQYGISINPNAGKAGFITGTYTVMVPIFYLLFFRKKTGINVLIGAACAVLGLYLLSVTNGFGSIELSDIVLFIGAIFWTFHIILIDNCINKVSAIKFSSVQFLICSLWGFLLLFATSKLTVNEMLNQTRLALIPILYMGIFSSGVGYTSQALGQRDANPTYAAIILSLESVFAAVGGVLFGIDSAMTVRKYIGCAFIFIGIIFSQISFKNKKEPKCSSQPDKEVML